MSDGVYQAVDDCRVALRSGDIVFENETPHSTPHSCSFYRESDSKSARHFTSSRRRSTPSTTHHVHPALSPSFEHALETALFQCSVPTPMARRSSALQHALRGAVRTDNISASIRLYFRLRQGRHTSRCVAAMWPQPHPEENKR